MKVKIFGYDDNDKARKEINNWLEKNHIEKENIINILQSENSDPSRGYYWLTITIFYNEP